MSDTRNFDYGRTARASTRAMNKLIELIKASIVKPATVDNVAHVKVLADQLQSEYNSFRAVVNQAIDNITFDAKKPDEVKEAEKYETTIHSDLDNVIATVLPYIAKAKRFVSDFECEKARESLNDHSLNTSANAEPNTKLPRITIPKFDGNLEDFLEFSALFQNVIHEEASLSKVRKLYYLKESLTGSASELIKDIPLNERGYDEAWGLVQSTYKDIKAIVRKHLDKLFAIGRVHSANEIPCLLASVNRCLKGLKACGEDPDNWSTIVCYMVSEKLDKVTYLEFEKSLTTNTKFPSWKTLRTFLETRASVTKRTSDGVKPGKSKVGFTGVNSNRPKFDEKTPPRAPKCASCSQFHLLIDCDEFKSKTPKQRYELLKAKNFCLNCFKSNHKTSDCKRAATCKKCNSYHHTLLHFEHNNDTTQTKPPSGEGTSNPDQTKTACLVAEGITSSLLSTQESFKLLPTAVVTAKFGSNSVKMRVLLDSCSQDNLISKSFIDRYKIPTLKTSGVQKIATVGASTPCNRSVNLRLCSNTEPFEFNTTFNVITADIPYSVHNLHCGDLREKLSGLKLADPEFLNPYVNIQIDGLLGIEAYDLCVQGPVRHIDNTCLRNTRLGWTLSSQLTANRPIANEMYCGLTINESIDQRLKLFWETEEIPAAHAINTEAELCNAHFEKTYSQNPDGKFVLRLPFKQDPSCITNNYEQALAHYNRSQKRLTEVEAKMYADFMQEYADLGHMTLVPEDDTKPR